MAEEDKGEEDVRLKVSRYIGYTVQSPKRARTRRLLFEITRLAETDSDLGQECISWMESLNPQERHRAISLLDPLYATVLRGMFFRKVEQGEVSFMCTEEMKNASKLPKDPMKLFYARQRDLATQGKDNLREKLEWEKEMEQRVRFTDQESYLDVITVDSKLAEDLPHFLDLMSHITDGKAFSSPCKAHFDGKTGQWYFESPLWLFPSFNSLAVWAGAWLERGIWMNYWRATGLDPRFSTDSPAFQSDFAFADLPDFLTLSDFWTSLDSNSQEIAIVEMETSGKEFSTAEKRISELYGLTTIDLESSQGVNRTQSITRFNKTSGSYYQKYHSLITQYNESESVSILKTKAEEHQSDFLEHLLFSSLDRAFTLYDVCARRLAAQIRNFHGRKIALSLIAEEPETTSIPTLKPKTSKRKKRISKIETHAETTDFGRETSEDDSGRIVCAGIMKTIIDTVMANIEIETPVSWPFINKPGSSTLLLKMKELEPSPSAGKQKKSKKKKPKRPKKPVPNDVVGAYVPPAIKKPAPPATVRLHHEIKSFCQALSSRLQASKGMRQDLLSRLTKVCQDLFPSCELRIYGSYPLGLALESSDIDTVLLHASDPFSLLGDLNRLGKALEGLSWVAKVTVIDTASVPIIKLETVSAGLEVVKIDVTFDDRAPGAEGTHRGLERCEYLQKLIEEKPPLRELTLVLKQLLAAHDMNSAYRGHLSSYSLLLWTAARLFAKEFQGRDLGELLMDFLSFYTFNFDPKSTGINVTVLP